MEIEKEVSRCVLGDSFRAGGCECVGLDGQWLRPGLCALDGVGKFEAMEVLLTGLCVLETLTISKSTRGSERKGKGGLKVLKILIINLDHCQV